MQQDPGDYRLTDDEVMGLFGELHCVAAFCRRRRSPMRRELAHLQRQCYQQMVLSTMVLSSTEYLVEIRAKKRFPIGYC